VDVREPAATDGMAVHRLIAQCPPLDPNSVYCNLLQCSHFSSTSVLVEARGEVVAFMSAYVRPDQPDVLFVWQVAVAEAWRGHGLAGRMLETLVQRPALNAITFIETTVTPSNQASANVFRRFADKRHTPLNTSILFSQAAHFAGSHDDEVLFRIGPLRPQQSPSQ
jgi:L-2,4-diaminobutyric acid acetyltransferase